MAIHISDIELWQEWARQDNAFDLFVPSDIRQMLGEIVRLRALKTELRAALEGVVKVADRNTVEFNRARVAIAAAK